MAKRTRKALARSPIDRVITPPEAPASSRRASKTRDKKTEARPVAKRVAHTIRIRADLLDECRSAVVTLAGAPLRLTLSDLVESALERELQRLKRKHNEGEDFPAYKGKLRAGRPIGT